MSMATLIRLLTSKRWTVDGGAESNLPHEAARQLELYAEAMKKVSDAETLEAAKEAVFDFETKEGK